MSQLVHEALTIRQAGGTLLNSKEEHVKNLLPSLVLVDPRVCKEKHLKPTLQPTVLPTPVQKKESEHNPKKNKRPAIDGPRGERRRVNTNAKAVEIEVIARKVGFREKLARFKRVKAATD